MADQQLRREEPEKREEEQNRPGTVDAIRHVGPTLEAEGIFLPSDELPENRIETEGLAETVNVRAVIADKYDREAEAMGAEPLRTRLPGDTSSDPHSDLGPDNATNLDDERSEAA